MEDSAPKERPTLTANQLRRLAEKVDGMRDQTVYVVWVDGKPRVKSELEQGDELIFTCETKNRVPQRPKFKSIALDPPVLNADGTVITDVAERFDAMFWSEAAVEKFVLPYYSRFKTADEINRLQRVFNQPSVYALVHMPDTSSFVLTSIRTGEKGLEILTIQELEGLL
ncbi:MAG: hypothetical protein ACR2GG_09165 [Gemmatimonadaceae bacterium]